MTRPRWRLLDTGLRRAAENIALNRALLEARQAGEAPPTLRFLRFAPSALIGCHQSAAQELELDYCRARGIAVQRRITGGGAIYFDPAQLGWELYLDRADAGTDMAAISRRICEAAAAGLSRLGVAARFRPRNDIEVEGRKISGTGGAFDGDALLYQGTLLIDFDAETMLRVLRVPAAKLSDKAVASVRERVVSLRELLGEPPPLERIQHTLAAAFAESFGVEWEAAGLVPAEERRFEAALAEIDTPGWVFALDRPRSEAPLLSGSHRCPGGLIHADLLVDTRRRRLKQVWIRGDFFVVPPRTIADLEAALRDVPLEDLDSLVEDFFAGREVQMLQLSPRDFVQAMANALASREAVS